MNGTANEPMMPAWAERELEKPSSQVELEMLRHFFDSWEALHAIPNERGNRSKSEAAAQVLVDAAHAVRAMRGTTAPRIQRLHNGG